MKKLILPFLFIFAFNLSFAQSKLIITGVFDAHPSGAGAKGVEVFATDLITDFNNYGLGSANNGQGTDGQEFTFPELLIEIQAGTSFFVTNDSIKFYEFFGFSADYESNMANINGDDAIELFYNGVVVDVVGDSNIDGTGTAWEHLDSWLYRKDGTGPDDSTFVLDNWKVGELQALRNIPTNDDASDPYPIKSYSPDLPIDYLAFDDEYLSEYATSITFNVFDNDTRPDLADTNDFSIIYTNENANIDDSQFPIITYTPNNGYCGLDRFQYFSGSDTAQVEVTVTCEITYPMYDIATITTNDAVGLPDSLNVHCTITGRVYGGNFKQDGLSFTIIDKNNDGIKIYKDDESIQYEVREGDVVEVYGKVTQYNGLTELVAEGLKVVNETISEIQPMNFTELNESTESQLIKHSSKMWLVDSTQWGSGSSSGFNVDITDGVDTFNMRIDNDIDLYTMNLPVNKFYITGIGGQFDSSSPYESGYQIFPRSSKDLEFTLSTNHILSSKVNIYPNPVLNNLNIDTDVKFDNYIILDNLGREIKNKKMVTNVIKTDFLIRGVYFIKLVSVEGTALKQFVK